MQAQSARIAVIETEKFGRPIQTPPGLLEPLGGEIGTFPENRPGTATNGGSIQKRH